MKPGFGLLDHVPIGIIVCGKGLSVRHWNTSMEDWTGIRSAEIVGRELTGFFPRFAEDRYRMRLDMVLRDGTPVIFSYQLNGCLFAHRDPARIERVQHATATRFCGDDGEALLLIAVEDRSEVSARIKAARAELATRIEAEATLRTAVQEKEFLMQELNHRIKNNLNMILSLINLQKEGMESENLRSALDDLDSRIRSFAVLHETLHRGGNPQAVRLDHYIGEISREIFDTMSKPASKAALRVDIAPVERPFRDALYIGLIVSEAITNSMKYALSEAAGTGRRVEVSIREEGDALALSVSDDGPGFPEGVRPEEGDSLGLKLVQLLAAELGGKVSFSSGPGATVSALLSSGSGSTST